MKKYFLVILICTLNAITISAQETDKIEYKNLVVEKARHRRANLPAVRILLVTDVTQKVENGQKEMIC